MGGQRVPRREAPELVHCDVCGGECFDFREREGRRACIACVGDEGPRAFAALLVVLEAARDSLIELGARPTNSCPPNHCRYERASKALRLINQVLPPAAQGS